jgi:hypothetical protein
MIQKSKYQPWSAHAVSWDEIEVRYIRNWAGAHVEMLKLVRYIKNSELAKRLYGSTSMDKLVVSIYNPLDYRKESLHITYGLESNKWQFEYYALPFQEPEFVRTYEAEKGIEKFEDFIRMIKW